MIDLYQLSIISSVRIDSSDRLTNTELFLRFFETFFHNYEIVLIEQDSSSQLTDIVSNRPGLRHHLVKAGSCHHKTRNLNLAAALSTGGTIMMCDIDVFVPPAGICESLAMLNAGYDFVAPYNGVVVEISKRLSAAGIDFHTLLSSLTFFDRNYDLQMGNHDFAHFKPIYGGRDYEALGGAIICKREPLFLAGAWNENFISYGFEDMEFHHRVSKLGYKTGRVSSTNCYHFEHMRGADSYYNNFYRANEQEYERVTGMTADELRCYVDNGFKHLGFDTQLDFDFVNSTDTYAMRTQQSGRVNLADVATILLLQQRAGKQRPDCDRIFDFFEEHFDNHLIFVVEIGSRACKYWRNKKNMQYLWLTSEEGPEAAVEAVLRQSNREFVDLRKCERERDVDEIIARYSTLERGNSLSEHFVRRDCLVRDF